MCVCVCVCVCVWEGGRKRKWGERTKEANLLNVQNVSVSLSPSILPCAIVSNDLRKQEESVQKQEAMRRGIHLVAELDLYQFLCL